MTGTTRPVEHCVSRFTWDVPNKVASESTLKTLNAVPFALILIATTILAGCGQSRSKTFKVTGTVSFTQTPLSEGTITFDDSSTGVSEAFKIRSNGSYTATLPEGSYSVSIQPPMVNVADSAQSEGGEEFKKVDNIPSRYWTSYESKLNVRVTQDAVFDVDMVKRRN